MAVTFEFIKRLGSGYFGEVWKVKDTGLNSTFALKLIPPEKVINPKNFYQEAQTLKAAEHENIVEVYETGELDDGRIYVKMEFLSNGSLEDEASGAYVPLSRTKRLMIDLLRGLEHAHSKKILHRDIKPANIMIGNSGEGKLSDFGLALPDIKMVDVSVLKKYQYWMHLAPEVNSLTDYTYLSDIYSCGMTLYRLVNGDSFLPPLTISELRIKALEGKFPDRKLYRDFIPVSLKKLINKAMHVEPKERFSSAEQMRHALEKIELNHNWLENKLSNGYRWRSSQSGKLIQLSKTKKDDGNWEIELSHGKNKNSLRRITIDCKKGISKLEADKISKRILQDYVIGKRK
ncbi:Serine/threonine protein kinase [Aquiflexum balticum DSM 16537]|uniref:Serine/threonine protein kinase n=1 Tax=Aquiflexum balticum DSM 16537 TaxID=758820 RepID=A0A1W2HBY4_9BACT|nr:serine/threonine-protein kinase [Aquiflexum balticum]SMD46367.1 Serine/threonine protein kinase [Aquiflexum balticum DSM 16537]